MGPIKALNLPVIKFVTRKLEPGTSEWNSVKSQVFEALEYYGSFEAVYDGISEDVRRTILSETKGFFELPMETKMRANEKIPYHGYAGLPNAEGMGLERVNEYDSIDSYTKRVWTEGNSDFTKSIYEYANRISALDKIIRRMIFESLGVEKYLDEHLNSTYYNFRMNHYVPPIIFQAHQDPSMLSILHQSDVNGLEIQAKGGEWILYKPSSSHSYVIFIGESLFAWTNGRLHCPFHKVTVEGDKERYSFVLFGYQNKGYLVKTPEELVEDEHPLLFKPFDHYDFLIFSHKEIFEKQYDRSLKAYCGI